MKSPLTTLPFPATVGLFFAVGLCVGQAVFRWGVRLTSDASATPRTPAGGPVWCFVPLIGPLTARDCRCRDVPLRGWGTLTELACGLLFAAFIVAKIAYRCQEIPEVRPDEFWRDGRIVFHLVLIALLMAATVADFREYVIPDQIVLPGVLFAVAMAFGSGDLQTVHVWVDATQEIPGLKGAYIPQWIKDHHHWHGLAWSLAGLAAGAGLTWLLRLVSSLLLGQEALGFGDVTLMAMIGSFTGWQPVLAILVLAPFCGVAMAVGVRLLSRKTYVPYGPFLAAATLIVLFGWRWIWTFTIDVGLREPFSVRKLFGDWIALLILTGIAFAALIALLLLLRLYRAAPGKREDEMGVDPSERSGE
ncbi:MAG: prepilin peptidase [Planctomycetaceae bacterium]